jgi:hypothetical protein
VRRRVRRTTRRSSLEFRSPTMDRIFDHAAACGKEKTVVCPRCLRRRLVMKIHFIKTPMLARVFFKEIISLVAIALFSLLVVTVAIGHESIYPSGWIVLSSFFFGIFFVGALFFGASGVVRSAISVSRHLLRKDNLNSQSTCEQIQLLIFFSIEIVIAVIFFVSVAWIFPDAINFDAFFQSI